MERLASNPFLRVGMKAVEDGMKDVTSKTFSALPDEVCQQRKKLLLIIRGINSGEEIDVIDKILLCRRSSICSQKTHPHSLSISIKGRIFQ